MATEVEIKAWVDDMEELRSRVRARYRGDGSYVKEDRYYRLPAGPAGDVPGGLVEFRLRMEGRAAFVTGKRKSVVEGVEINDEIEFTVSDPSGFQRFAEYLGAEVFARKRKSGERYRAGEATIELSHVDRLGDFIEIERLVKSAGTDTSIDSRAVRAAEREVRSLLRELGVAEEKIEPRYYVDMLAEL